MKVPSLLVAGLAVLAIPIVAAARAQALVPAGSINAAIASKPVAVLAPSDPAALPAVTASKERFFKQAALLVDTADTSAHPGSLVVYGTPQHPWIVAHAERLPFRWKPGEVEIDGRRFEGEHLRVIAALRHPAERSQRVVLYWAEHPQDLGGIHVLFHGPTEWVVADGGRALASGSFLAAAALTPEAMARDLDELVARIAEVHPAAVEGLPEPVAEAARLCRERIGKPLGRMEFARECAGVLLALQDAHSALALPASGETLALPLVWLEEGLVVSADAGELRRGDRVLALGGKRESELLAAISVLLPAENPHWLRHRAPALLADLGMLAMMGAAAKTPVAVTLEREGKRVDVQVPAGPLPGPTGNAEPWVRFEIDAPRSLGVLTVDRCVLDKTYERTVHAFFQAVHEQGVRRVAVDLRANSGGDSRVVNAFLRYLKLVFYDDFSGDVRWSRPALEQRKARGEVRFEPAKKMRRPSVPHADPPPFEGELFVLTGPATFSSASWFAVVLHDNGLAKIVGEPTGNAPSSYGDVLAFTLPESCSSYSLSFKRWVRPNRGLDPAPTLSPHVHVPRTRASVRAGTDPVLEWLRSL